MLFFMERELYKYEFLTLFGRKFSRRGDNLLNHMFVFKEKMHFTLLVG